MKVLCLLALLAVVATKNTLAITPISFHLYTKSNPCNGIEISTSTASLAAAKFNPANPTCFVIHGWLQGYYSITMKSIRNAWLSRGDANVILVDWASARLVSYLMSVEAVPRVGQSVAGMIDYLVRNYNLNLNTLEVIGHSLGAHVAGFTGKNVKAGKIQVIYGLDPALPAFASNTPEKRLSSTDAVDVIGIHTNGGQLGFLAPIGKIDFYPNGGQTQPSCLSSANSICSHVLAITYYVQALRNNGFPTIKCSDYQQAVKKSCGATYSSIRMGVVTPDYSSGGIYYVPIN